MKEAATRLDDAWRSGADKEYEKDFFLERQSQRTFEIGRRKLHDVIDETMTKRRRRDYDDENAAFDKGVQSDADSDDSIEYVPLSQKPLVDQVQDDLQDNEVDSSTGDEELDLPTGFHTPPKHLQGYYDEVPLVEDSEAIFHHNDNTSKFRLSDEDQALYDKAAVWFKSMLGRDTDSAIQKLQNTRFHEPWVHDLLYDM
ncbi:hypothetical protein BGZ83_006459 [Gryganskiella cystojenkinii]|nr:hypothetical protein BGZ83_006459 [Gryganskiella cystojenkinii]